MNTATRSTLMLTGLAVLGGCRDQRSVTSPHGISADFSDGRSAGGNPHFFFLPPLVGEPTFSGMFNPNLRPVVDICQLTVDAQQHPIACDGTAPINPGPVQLDLVDEQYQVNWHTDQPPIDVTKFYRIEVRGAPGARVLGFADIAPVVNGSQLQNVNTGQYIGLKDGRTLPITFRIERGAFCTNQTDCGEATVGAGGGTVITNTGLAGVFIPAGALSSDVLVAIEVITARPCLPIDLLQRGGCYQFTTDPGPTRFNLLVTPGICVETAGLTATAISLLHLHQLDFVEGAPVVTPLPNVAAHFLTCDMPHPPPPSLGLRRGTLGRLLAVGTQGVRALLGLVRPAPLFAAHLGVGGLTCCFSRIGWALPAQMNKQAGDGQAAVVGTPVPTPPSVIVKDSSGTPVPGEAVTFSVSSGGGTVTGATAVTGAQGVATVGSWKLGPTPETNTLIATSRGAVGSPIAFAATGTAIAVPARFAYVPNSGSSNISAYTIDAASGALAPVAGSPFAAGMSPRVLVVDPTGKFAYVPNAGSNNVSAYTIDASLGVLTPVTGSPFLTGSSPADKPLMHPTGHFLYVVNKGSNSVSAYTIDATSGALTPVMGSPFGAGLTPASPEAVDPTGQFLYVVNEGSNDVSAYRINATSGALTPVQGSPFAAGTVPSWPTVNPTGQFLYVGNRVSNDVSAYRINATSGALTPVTGSPFAAGVQPCWGVTVHPTGKFAYMANEGSANVSAYAIDGTTGALTPVVGSPFGAGTQPCWATVDPTGQFLYVANRGSSNISAYTIDATSGRLTPVAESPFAAGAIPEGPTFDPTGRFLYAANAGSNTISAYAIDGTTGKLTPVSSSPFATQTTPYWVTVTAGPAPAALGSWTTKAPMPTVRLQLGVGMVNGILYAIGGRANNNFPVATVEAYDPGTDTWMPKAPLPTPEQVIGVGAINGKLYVVSPDGTTYQYDPATDSWTSKAPRPVPAVGPGVGVPGVGVINGKLYSVGGGGPIQEYDPVTDTWTARTPLPVGRYWVGVGVINGHLYAVGGNGIAPLPNAPLATVEEYDPGTDTWTTKASLPTPVGYPGVGVVNGILYVDIGSALEAYDPAADTWSPRTTIPTTRWGVGVGVINGILYVVGGATGYYPNYGALGTLEAFQP